MRSRLATLLANKHTSGSAIVFALGEALAQIGPIWLPTHGDKFKATGHVLQQLAFVYGMLMAGDASQSVSKQDLEEMSNKPNPTP